MKPWLHAVCRGLLALVTLTTASRALADDQLATARDLYASAAYEEALAALNRLSAASVAPEEALSVKQYRAFCLLALGQGAEARTAIEAVVAADPLYHPSEAEVSPRVRTAFSEVRRRILPSIIQQQYAQAKAAFDRKDYSMAAAGFNQVLAALADPDVAQAADQPPFSDIRTLAIGFGELSAKAAEPPPPVPRAPAPEPAPAAAPAPAPLMRRVFTRMDSNVAPPVAIRQDLPSFPGLPAATTAGVLEVLIDERGLVESAVVRTSISPSYDKAVLNAVRAWRYEPATVDGVPVRFSKVIQITVKPTS